MADIKSDDPRSPTLQQTVGESTGAGANINGCQSTHVKAKGIESCIQFPTSSTDKGRRWALHHDGLSR
jgi:hypothetical protein